MSTLTLAEPPALTFGERLARNVARFLPRSKTAATASPAAAARAAELLAIAEGYGYEDAPRVAAHAAELMGDAEAAAAVPSARADRAAVNAAAQRAANAAGLPTDVPAPKAAATKKAWTATWNGKQHFASDSPTLALARWTQLLRDARGQTRSTPRLVGATEVDLQKAAAAASAGKESQADTPEAVLNALSIGSHWDGRGIQYHVVAGADDQFQFSTPSWREAVLAGKECEAACEPVQIHAEHDEGRRATFYKHGQTWGERGNERRAKAEIAEKAKGANTTKDAAAKEVEALNAKLASLSAQATQRSGIALSLVAPAAAEVRTMAGAPQTKDQLEAALDGKSFEEKRELLRVWNKRQI